jgi:hypothetical protein
MQVEDSDKQKKRQYQDEIIKGAGDPGFFSGIRSKRPI